MRRAEWDRTKTGLVSPVQERQASAVLNILAVSRVARDHGQRAAEQCELNIRRVFSLLDLVNRKAMKMLSGFHDLEAAAIASGDYER